MTDLPKTHEEMLPWIVQKIGEVHTQNAVMNGKLDVAIAQHLALEDRVDGVEATIKTAKQWENGKMLVLLFLQGVAAFFHRA